MSIGLLISLTIVIVLLICASGVFSFSEMAFASLNLIRIKTIAKNENNKKESERAKRVLYLRERYNETTTSIVIINNVINIIATTISAFYFDQLIGSGGGVGLIVSTIVMSILIITFGEIIPKMFAKKYPEKGALKLINVLNITYLVFLPITKGLAKIVPFKGETMFTNEEEFNEALLESNKVGIIDANEKELIHNTLKFDKSKLKNVMTPLKSSVSIKENIKQKDLEDVIISEGYSRYPIMNEEGKVIGIFSVKKYLAEKITNKESTFRENFKNSIFDPIFLDDDINTKTAFENLKSERKSMAVVVNALKTDMIVGIITIEDLIEEIVGEIYDENDITENGIYELGIGTIEISFWSNAQNIFDSYFPNLKEKPILKTNQDFGNWVFKTFNSKNLAIKDFFKETSYVRYENLLIWIKRHNEVPQIIKENQDFDQNSIIFEVDIIEGQ